MGKRRKRKAIRKAVKNDPLRTMTQAELASRAYEAALSTPTRRHVIGADKSQDSAANEGFSSIRDWARYLDENSDLAVGLLDTLQTRVVGNGIMVLPKPLRADGSIDESLGADIMEAWRRWTRRPDVTGELDFNELQRLACRAWFRDGEQFAQHISGRDAPFPFEPQQVPYRIELLESEMVPWELTNDDGWRQGIQLNGWRAPTAYGVHEVHPGDADVNPFAATIMPEDVRVIPAPFMTHLKLVKRCPQTRGISIFASVISRLYDVKDLEESERLKNRILASWCAAIRKSPDIPGVKEDDSNGDRYLEMASGAIIDTLGPGEDIVGVGPDYPVAGMADYIADQIRRLASGTGTNYSSISKNYNGTYSAQRQELVESEGMYRARTDRFVSRFVRPVYERWILAALLDGKIVERVNGPEDLERIANAEYIGPATAWIDPLREAQADKLAVDEEFTTRDQIRIKRGAPPELIGKPDPEPREPAQLSLIPDEDDQDDEQAEAA